MQFPFIETAFGHFEKERNCDFFIENVLVELPKKRGQSLKCITSDYIIVYK